MESLLNLLLYKANSHFPSTSRQGVPFVVLGHKKLGKLDNTLIFQDLCASVIFQSSGSEVWCVLHKLHITQFREWFEFLRDHKHRNVITKARVSIDQAMFLHPVLACEATERPRVCI